MNVLRRFVTFAGHVVQLRRGYVIGVAILLAIAGILAGVALAKHLSHTSRYPWLANPLGIERDFRGEPQSHTAYVFERHGLLSDYEEMLLWLEKNDPAKAAKWLPIYQERVTRAAAGWSEDFCRFNSSQAPIACELAAQLDAARPAVPEARP